MLYKEDKYTELKESYSTNIMKTISAFSNGDGGRVIIGVEDNGEIIGVNDPVQSKLNLENSINDLVLQCQTMTWMLLKLKKKIF